MLARGLDVDVARNSGLALGGEAFAEVLPRELAAMWYLDRFPEETDAAEFLCETAVGSFGEPKGLSVEARHHLKLTEEMGPADSSNA